MIGAIVGFRLNFYVGEKILCFIYHFCFYRMKMFAAAEDVETGRSIISVSEAVILIYVLLELFLCWRGKDERSFHFFNVLKKNFRIPLVKNNYFLVLVKISKKLLSLESSKIKKPLNILFFN